MVLILPDNGGWFWPVFRQLLEWKATNCEYETIEEDREEEKWTK